MQFLIGFRLRFQRGWRPTKVAKTANNDYPKSQIIDGVASKQVSKTVNRDHSKSQILEVMAFKAGGKQKSIAILACAFLIEASQHSIAIIRTSSVFDRIPLRNLARLSTEIPAVHGISWPKARQTMSQQQICLQSSLSGVSQKKHEAISCM